MSRNSFMWVPFVGLLVGLWIPLVFLDAALTEDQEKIMTGIGLAMFVFIYALFTWLTSNRPKLKEWLGDSVVGATLALSVGAFLVSAGSISFSLLPIPFWLHVIIAVLLALIALMVMISVSSNSR